MEKLYSIKRIQHIQTEDKLLKQAPEYKPIKGKGKAVPVL